MPRSTKSYQRAVALVIHRRDDVLHACDRRERLRAVNVPGDFVEHGEERVDRDEPHARFDEPPREQATLAEAGHAVTLANFQRLLREIERFARLRARHQAIGRREIVIHQQPRSARLEILHRGVDDFAQLAASLQPRFADFLRRQQVGHFEIFLRRIGIQRERIVRLAEETGVLAVRQIAAGRPHRLRQDDVRRQFGFAAFQIFQRATGVRRVDAAGEQPAGLHHLMAGVVHRRRRVINTAHERKLVRDLGLQRKNLGDLNVGIVGADRLERPANFARRIGLHVPGVELARRAEIENHDAGFFVAALGHRAHRLHLRELRHAQADCAQRADLEKVAPRDSVARRDRTFSSYFKHISKGTRV